jgi:hypothetical protein
MVTNSFLILVVTARIGKRHCTWSVFGISYILLGVHVPWGSGWNAGDVVENPFVLCRRTPHCGTKPGADASGSIPRRPTARHPCRRPFCCSPFDRSPFECSPLSVCLSHPVPLLAFNVRFSTPAFQTFAFNARVWKTLGTATRKANI